MSTVLETQTENRAPLGRRYVARTSAGVVWVVVVTTTEIELHASDDEGATWTVTSAVAVTNSFPSVSIFIDHMDYLHFLWADGSGPLNYKMAVLSGTSVGYWNTPIEVDSASATRETPLLVAHSGRDTHVHVVWNDNANGYKIRYRHISVDVSETDIATPSPVQTLAEGAGDGGNPAIEFNHNGGGRTGGLPRIVYITWVGADKSVNLLTKSLDVLEEWSDGSVQEIGRESHPNAAGSSMWQDLASDGTHMWWICYDEATLNVKRWALTADPDVRNAFLTEEADTSLIGASVFVRDGHVYILTRDGNYRTIDALGGAEFRGQVRPDDLGTQNLYRWEATEKHVPLGQASVVALTCFAPMFSPDSLAVNFYPIMQPPAPESNISDLFGYTLSEQGDPNHVSSSWALASRTTVLSEQGLTPTGSIEFWADTEQFAKVSNETLMAAGNIENVLSYNNQRKLARTSDDALWTVYYAVDGGTLYFPRSLDDGRTWQTYGEAATLSVAAAENQAPSLFVDESDYFHVVRQSGSEVTYARGVLSGGVITWTELALPANPAHTTDITAPDVVVLPHGGGWVAHVAYSSGPDVYHASVDIDSGGALSVRTAPQVVMTFLSQGDAAALASIDFRHTGDGKTPHATPHLYVAATGPQGVKSVRATYSAGSWSWDTPTYLAANGTILWVDRGYGPECFASVKCIWDATNEQAIVARSGLNSNSVAEIRLYTVGLGGERTSHRTLKTLSHSDPTANFSIRPDGLHVFFTYFDEGAYHGALWEFASESILSSLEIYTSSPNIYLNHEHVNFGTEFAVLSNLADVSMGNDYIFCDNILATSPNEWLINPDGARVPLALQNPTQSVDFDYETRELRLITFGDGALPGISDVFYSNPFEFWNGSEWVTEDVTIESNDPTAYVPGTALPSGTWEYGIATSDKAAMPSPYASSTLIMAEGGFLFERWGAIFI